MLLILTAINQIVSETQARWSPSISEYCVASSNRQMRSPEFINYLLPRVTNYIDRSSARLNLAELAKLKQNWDAYEADPISGGCIDRAHAVLNALPSKTPSPDITPNPNGTLTLDWETEDQALSLELGVTRFSCFWESMHGIKTDDGLLDQDIPLFVTKALASMFSGYELTPPPEWSTINAYGKHGRAAVACYR